MNRRELLGRIGAVIGASFISDAKATTDNAVAPEISGAAWPTKDNTGPPPGQTRRLHQGDLVLDKAGQSVSGLDIQGVVWVNAPNVTLKDCSVSVSHYVVIAIKNRVTGTRIENCDISGVGFKNDGSHGIRGTGTFLRNNISNVENGITVDDGGDETLIQDNYIHSLLASGSPHYDGIQIDGNISNVTIRHNTIINDHDQTSAIMIDNYFGPISNIVVENNLLLGGGYTIYVDGQFNDHPIAGVSITGNAMGRGRWGITAFNRTSPIYKENIANGKLIALKLGLIGPPTKSGL